jgi:DNA-binding CsgD family transcriptional regulator
MELARRLGGLALVAQARAELLAAGRRSGPIASAGVGALTASERRVADMAATGLTNRQIALALFVTIKAIEGHLAHAYAKLEISSRKDLTRALTA